MTAIAIGVPHRALETLELLVYTYDALRVDTELLRKGALFQPWQPLGHWRGVRVPLTVGADARDFVWDASSPSARFLRWHDFLERCAPAEAEGPSATPRSRHHEKARASPFDELAAIGARLRARAKSAADLAAVDAILARRGARREARRRGGV